MKRLLVLFSALLLQAASVCVLAQDKPKAGDVIRGIVRNSDGPMAGVHIEEIDFYDEFHDITLKGRKKAQISYENP